MYVVPGSPLCSIHFSCGDKSWIIFNYSFFSLKCMKSHVRMLTSREDLIGICKTMSGIKSVDRDLSIILPDSTRNSDHQMKWAVPRFRTDKHKVLNLCNSLTKIGFGVPNIHTVSWGDWALTCKRVTKYFYVCSAQKVLWTEESWTLGVCWAVDRQLHVYVFS